METNENIANCGILSSPLSIRIRTDGVQKLDVLRKENPHVWIDPHFSMIVEKATLKPPLDVNVSARQIMQKACSDKIKSVLRQEECEFKVTPFCYLLAHELKKVLEGRDSEILVRDGWCLFYVEIDEVFIRWNTGSQVWSICVWHYEGKSTWNKNNRVYTPISIH